ncbi:MAG: LacI family transcriptional regulator [Clostridiaceae bacterium]|nr:LacI family transcriptional regulator [Clostridiaceae bacterium]
MTTIREVAKAAGVSRSTVSLVLNNSPLVKDETRERVLKVIKELDYVPNAIARGLSNQITYNLGIIVMQDDTPRESYDFDQHTGLCSYNISTGIIEGLVDSNYGVITEYFPSIENSDELPRLIKNKRVDGAFIVGSPYHEKMLNRLLEMNFPFVMVGVNSYMEGVDSVLADPAEGVRICVEYMHQMGHEKLCYINSPDMFISSVVRRNEFIKATTELDLDIDESWILQCRYNNGKSSKETFKKFWDAGNRPGGIIAANTRLALGVRSYLHDLGVRVPEEVSIMSYEDSALAGYATPALTTVDIQKELLGRKAAFCLLKRLENPEKSPEKIIIPAKLVVRDSVYNRRRN